MFQSTHPHGVRRRTCFSVRKFACFNPRTHTGCDTIVMIDTHMTFVSIHAPTRGATRSVKYCGFCSYVSIHAPTRGATMQAFAYGYVLKVSIHAPTRGATVLCKAVENSTLFQSTHPHGVRRKLVYSPKQQHQFQSTHPHGVRPLALVSFRCLPISFNPRTHTGCDLGAVSG